MDANITRRNSRCEVPALRQIKTPGQISLPCPTPLKISFARRQWSLATSLRPRVLDRTHDMIGQHITLRHKTYSPEKDITATVHTVSQ